MSRCYPTIARSTIALILLVLAPSASAALECYSSALRDNRHWSWRQVDGRRCWYPGLPGVSKSKLRWSKTSIPPSKDRQTSAGAAAPPPSSQRDEDEVLLQSIWPPLSAGSKSTPHWSKTSNPPSKDRQTNATAAAPPPSSRRDEEEVLLQSTWPPLSADSFEERFVGAR
jgi:hypothetical protein